MTDRPVLAINIGGVRLAAAAVDSGGRVSAAVRLATPTGPVVDAEVLWRTVLALIDQVRVRSGERDFAGVGVGCGGPMQWPAGEVSPLHLPAWRNFPLRKRLQEEFPHVPVRVHNDAICVAVGEHWRGAGRGVHNVLGVVVSAGVGGGLILDGRLVNGSSGNAGHLGHVIVDSGGPPCSCGGRGCLEAYVSGPVLVQWAASQGWRIGGTVRELAVDAERGHPVAQAAIRRAGDALGVAIASVTNLCDLDVVALGGDFSTSFPLLFGPLEEAFSRHVWATYARQVRIVPAELGQEAGLVGAAALVLAGDKYWSVD
ncbi:ROK family protein [Carbonactinospora thermoautotrophica]|nr:ROK family protein [Carbonactinospora thermoautotrophica]KWW99209.1 ROK family protein [Carbonactinospora thermoautotrophica]